MSPSPPPGSPEAWRAALAHVASSTQGPALDPTIAITVHFHPDHGVAGRGLLQHLATDGGYRSQFETGTSNGGLTAHHGGDRWRWESRLFGGAYDHLPAEQRPKYGSLNHRRRLAGGSVRFGSAHFRLHPHVLARATFCYPDSHLGPTAFATAEHMPLIALADRDDAAGVYDVLDDYVEAHVHGPLQLDGDVEAVVQDPAYRGTEVEQAARRLPVAVEWHHGFRLHRDELAEQRHYRGRRIVDVGRQVADLHAEDGWLDARVIGCARRGGRWDRRTSRRSSTASPASARLPPDTAYPFDDRRRLADRTRIPAATDSGLGRWHTTPSAASDGQSGVPPDGERCP